MNLVDGLFTLPVDQRRRLTMMLYWFGDGEENEIDLTLEDYVPEKNKWEEIESVALTESQALQLRDCLNAWYPPIHVSNAQQIPLPLAATPCA